MEKKASVVIPTVHGTYNVIGVADGAFWIEGNATKEQLIQLKDDIENALKVIKPEDYGYDADYLNDGDADHYLNVAEAIEDDDPSLFQELVKEGWDYLVANFPEGKRETEDDKTNHPAHIAIYALKRRMEGDN
jgi:predicted DNA-binding protein (MmcQ/YjbR family)